MSSHLNYNPIMLKNQEIAGNKIRISPMDTASIDLFVMYTRELKSVTDQRSDATSRGQTVPSTLKSPMGKNPTIEVLNICKTSLDTLLTTSTDPKLTKLQEKVSQLIEKFEAPPQTGGPRASPVHALPRPLSGNPTPQTGVPRASPVQATPRSLSGSTAMPPLPHPTSHAFGAAVQKPTPTAPFNHGAHAGFQGPRILNPDNGSTRSRNPR